MKYEIKLLGFQSDDNWDHYKWIVRIGDEFFEYRTAARHAVKRFDGRNHKFRTRPKDCLTTWHEDTDSWVKIPSIDHVLDCLISDAELGSESFNDFCSSLGYSSDSLKALDIYRACMETAPKLRKALGLDYQSEVERIQKLREEGDL